MSSLSSLLQERSASFVAVLFLSGSYIIYNLIQRVLKYSRHAKIIKEHGCKPIAKYPHKDPIFGLDIFLENVKLSRTGGFMEKVRERYARINGGVNSYSQLLLGDVTINTSEPENIKAILATQFKDFNLPQRRKDAFQPLLGHGIFSTDGKEWEISRALLRPSFARSLIGDLKVFESHISKLISKIPTDGSTFDIQDLFFKLTLDSGISHL